MRLADFRRLVDRMAGEMPPPYLEGVAAIEVSEKTVPHPARADVYTLGECIPIDTGGDAVTSRVVLYHGSFLALAADRADFDWREEAWETLTHELRHHLEWRANADALEAYDWAAEQNFAREEGEPFDPVFHLSGELVAPDVYKVDDDVFIDRVVTRVPPVVTVDWHGVSYDLSPPEGEPPWFLVLEGLRHAPAGEAVLVIRRAPRVRDLLRPQRPAVEHRVSVVPR